MEAPEQKKKKETVQEKPLESLQKKPEQVKPEVQVKPKPHATGAQQQSLVSPKPTPKPMPKPSMNQANNIQSPSLAGNSSLEQQSIKPPISGGPNPPYSASGGNANPMFGPSSVNPSFTGMSNPPYSASGGNANPMFGPSSVNPSFPGMSNPPYSASGGNANPMFGPSSVNPSFTGMPNPPYSASGMANPKPNVMPTAKAMAKQQAASGTKPIPLPTPVNPADYPAHNPYRYFQPFIGPFDPCPPMKVKRYVVPINQYINFQPMNLPQFSPAEALHRGTLWPQLFSPYEPK